MDLPVYLYRIYAQPIRPMPHLYENHTNPFREFFDMGFKILCRPVWNHIGRYESDTEPVRKPLLSRFYIVSIQTYIGGRFVMLQKDRLS
jgi:hypothetical protein